MSLHTVPHRELDFFTPRPIQVETAENPLTSDAGLILLRQFDHRIGFTQQFADALHDPRDPRRIEHSVRDMTRMRIFGILAGYEDQSDHDTLRTDPVFKLLADRLPDEVTAQLSYGDVRQILDWHLAFLSDHGLEVTGGDPAVVNESVVVDPVSSLDDVLERAAAADLPYTAMQVKMVLDAQLDYLDEIGAIGPVAGDT